MLVRFHWDIGNGESEHEEEVLDSCTDSDLDDVAYQYASEDFENSVNFGWEVLEGGED